MSVAFAGNAIYIMLTHDHDDLDRLPGRRPSAGRQDSRSTTSAVIVDLGIGRPVYTTVHYRRPSVSRRRGTNMEQIASRSDGHQIPRKRSKPN